MSASELGEGLERMERQTRKFRKVAVFVALFFVLLVFIGEGGCSSERPKRATTPAPAVARPYQRFVPIAHGQGFLSFPYWAFDTKTGQLCKTWPWESNDAASQKAQKTGDTSNLQGLDAAAASTSTCLSLLTQYPDK